jgi:hypothetical protein
MTKDDIILKIAQTQLGIETLELRNRDSLDFHDVSVRRLKEALETAYTAGQLAATEDQQKKIRQGGSYMAAIEVSYADLFETFGEPQPGTENKTEAQWIIRLPKKQDVKIYNYKNSKSYGSQYPDIKDVTRWHIGGLDTSLVDRIVRMLGGRAKLVHRQGE